MSKPIVPQARKKILVVGDWVVDEHWVIGIHRSPTSSRTGHSHYRALHKSSSTVESLCGAGRSASVLHQVRLGGAPFCNILGIGLWHEQDTDTLTAMLAPAWNRGQTPHQVSHPSAPPGGGVLFNLCNVIKPSSPSGTHDSYGTARMIRIYQHTGSRFDLLQRIDWEIQSPSEAKWPSQEKEDGEGDENQDNRETAWITSPSSLDKSDLRSFLDHHHDIDAVVIKDMLKGVISSELVSWLARRIKNVPWYISTKAWWPKWFGVLPKEAVRLLVVPQMSTQSAVRNGKLNCWITRIGRASQPALEELELLGKEFKNAIVIALPDGLSLLARDHNRSGGGKRSGIVQKEVGPETLAVAMPMASVFFSGMIAMLLKAPSIEMEPLLRRALQFTYNWMTLEVKRIEEPEDWQPYPEQALDLDCESQLGTSKPFDGNWQTFDWQTARANWRQALSRYGVISAKKSAQGEMNKKRLELSRAMTEVDGYVCCIGTKRQTLQRVVNELEPFNPLERRDHKSFMFIASPGSGKTFLVRRLAESLKFRFLGFNITQMLSKHDLLDCFDTIVTSQTQNKGERLMVFFDEINAKLDNQHVYDTFLAPLEELVYVRAGKTFHIDPCVWVFAGTDRPYKGTNTDKSDKASDFESRLTLEPLNLKADNAPNEEAGIERVYMGVAMLRSIFPDVRRVSNKVLQTFEMLKPDLEARELRRFVQAFVDIQYGEVRAKNVPRSWLRLLKIDTTIWSQTPENEMIEIQG